MNEILQNIKEKKIRIVVASILAIMLGYLGVHTDVSVTENGVILTIEDVDSNATEKDSESQLKQEYNSSVTGVTEPTK